MKATITNVLRLIILLCITSLSYSQVTFVEHVIDNHEYGASSVYAADINGDGFVDVIDSGSDVNRISYYKNSGTTPITFTKQLVDFSFTGAIFVSAADVNGDGNVDILGAAWEGNEIACWLNDGADPITWTKSSIDASINGAHEVHTADIDGDGDIDVLGASAEGHQIIYYENDGNNPVAWTKHIVGAQFFGARSVIGCDVNNDGHTDIVGAALTSDEVSVWLNDGNSPITWTKEVLDDSFDGSHWVHNVDFDDDGDMDIFAAAFASNEIAWYRNDGGSPITWSKQVIDNSFGGALAVATADLDHDGDLDAFGTAWNVDRLTWWRNDGGDPIQWTSTIIRSNLNDAWGLFGVDLDNDGDTDILSTAAADNEVTWWENTLATGVEEDDKIPVNFLLEQNYPNPFNPSTEISYRLMNESYVELKIYDMLGNEVATLLNEYKPAGSYSAQFDAENLTSGVYIYTLRAGSFTQSRKMTLLK